MSNNITTTNNDSNMKTENTFDDDTSDNNKMPSTETTTTIDDTNQNDKDTTTITGNGTNSSTNANNNEIEQISLFYNNFQIGCNYIVSALQQQQQNTTTNTNNDTTQTQVSSVSSVSSSIIQPPSNVLPDFLKYITINCIDPTTSSIMMMTNSSNSSNSNSASSSTNPSTTSTSSSSTRNVGYNAAIKKAKMNLSIQLYEKFIYILQKQYHNSLYNIHYSLFRNNNIKGIISILNIKTIITRGHGGSIVFDNTNTTTTNSNTNNNTLSSLSTSIWEQPYCYIYFAACESLDHYRTKVKPSIQVFISQLEASIQQSNKNHSIPSTTRTSRFRRNNATTTSNNDTNMNDTSLDESINESSNNMDGSNNNNSSNTTTTNNTTNNTTISTNNKKNSNKRIIPGPRFVIIYIPTGDDRSNATTTTTSESPFKRGTNNNSSTIATTLVGTNTTNTSTTSTSTTTSSLVGASVVSRLTAARQRMTAVATAATSRTSTSTTISSSTNTTGTTDTTTNETTISSTTITSTTMDGKNNNDDNNNDHQILNASSSTTTAVISTSSSLLPPIQQLNRMEREIERRLMNDFPNGNVCTLSTLLDTSIDNTTTTTTTSIDTNSNDTTTTIEHDQYNNQSNNNNNNQNVTIQQLEWQAVLKAIQNAIMMNFHDRCQRYDDEIRYIDHIRRTTTNTNTMDTSHDDSQTNTNTTSNNNDESMSDDLQLCNFFLVKENLALTYEQMRLPSEALLQYEELRAYLPDTSNNSNTNNTDQENIELKQRLDELSKIAWSGNILEFRHQLKLYNNDISSIIHIIEEYIFVREITLLFQMHESLQILRKCYSFIKLIFLKKKQMIDDMDISYESRQKLIDLYQWVFCYCWYIKNGSDCLLLMNDTTATATTIKSSNQIACARCICDILEFAQQCFDNVGYIVLKQSNIHRQYGTGFIQSLHKAWTPYQVPIISDVLPIKMTTKDYTTPQEFLHQALVSCDNFADCYCVLLDWIAKYHEYCGRRRYAARLRLQRIDLFDSKNDIVNATDEILSIFHLYKLDQWDACYFALLFRLACYQRNTASPLHYLDTLVRCFYHRVHDVAPKKALQALHSDLVSVIDCSEVQGSMYSAAPLFGPTFGLEGMASSVIPGNDRNLLKHLYTVGDTVRVNLSLKSFLSKEIVVDSIAINLVPFPTYVAAMEDNVAITKDDIHHVISLQNVTLSSGINELVGTWQPMNSGQVIIASVAIMWSGVTFSYTAKEIRRPTIRIDVVPCAPSQSLTVTPKYLIAGQEQPIQVEISTNNDSVVSGKVVLDGPSNVVFRKAEQENDTSDWTSSLDIPIPPCEPSKKVTVQAFAKVVVPTDSDEKVQQVHLNMSTNYKFTADNVIELATETLEASFDETITILDKALFTVQNCDVIFYSIDKAVLNALLVCNCPTNLVIKSWSIDLPSCYVLSNEGDMNESIVDEIVTNGDRVSFTFDCLSVPSSDKKSISDCVLHVDFENEVGAQFHESIKLRLKSGMDTTLKYLDVQSAIVKLSATVHEAFVCNPVVFCYSIDVGDVNIASTDITYHIATDHTDWIISGRNVGIIDASSKKQHDVTVIAIPTRPGAIRDYPSLSLTCQSDSVTTRTIPISMILPDPFTAISPSDHTSVAFLINNNSPMLSSLSKVS